MAKLPISVWVLAAVAIVSNSLPVCLFACLPVCLFACLPVCLFACLPVCLFACLPVCLFASPHCNLADHHTFFLSFPLTHFQVQTQKTMDLPMLLVNSLLKKTRRLGQPL
jgi:hypothetical protein